MHSCDKLNVKVYLFMSLFFSGLLLIYNSEYHLSNSPYSECTSPCKTVYIPDNQMRHSRDLWTEAVSVRHDVKPQNSGIEMNRTGDDVSESSPKRGSSQISSTENAVKSEEQLKDFKELNGVRVIPSKMVFTDAYDGKVFNQSFTIINAGKYTALVRVFSPTSKAFRMKPLPRGRYLASGMSITTKISYTYISAMAVPQACLSIYVNDELLLYEIEVFLSAAIITLKPKILNFGDIDVGTASEQMEVQLTNNGHKGAPFMVDLGRNDLELIVHPMKGFIKPLESIEIKVEILGTQQGTFLKEFWFKTSPPQRVWITGTFIRASLVIEHPLPIFDLTLIDFPKTYYGAQSKRTLVIENKSSTATMFCTLAEHQKEFKFLRDARKDDNNLKCFCITPREGRLMANHKYILGVSFIPKKIKKFTQKYCMTFIRILKVNYRDGIIDDKDIEVKTFSSSIDLDEYSIASLHDAEGFNTEELEKSDGYLRVCLYGEIEEAAVEITPNAIDLPNLIDGDTCVRTFNIKNNSNNLPITIRYNKISCIELEPEELTLNPSGNVDVSILIRPTRIGIVEHKVVLMLLYKSEDDVVYEVGRTFITLRYSTFSNPQKSKSKMKPRFNMGITPAITNEVGFLVDDTRYNSRIKKPMKAVVDEHFESFNKDNSQLIAFPNARQGGLRPWRCKVQCTTIFANLPRLVTTEDEYTLSKDELEKKQANDAYYANYLLSTQKKTETKKLSTDSVPDYDLTEKSALLLKKKWIYCNCPTLDFKDVRPSLFIPMPPEELMNIWITPRYIQLGKIAPFTSCSDYFAIENKNGFPVNISIRALSNSVVIKGKKRKVIRARKVENIYFDCYSHGLGKYYVPVYIIVNDCHVFDATVFAEVVPTTVKCSQKEVIICPRTHSTFIEMFNPVNCPIDFSWEVQDANYGIVPRKGKVPLRGKMFCEVMFTPQMDAIFSTEIYLLSQSGAKEIIRLVNENKKAEVMFHTDVLDFGDIPLNTLVTKNLILRNFSGQCIVVLLTDPNPLDEVSVSPTQGILPACSDIFFTVSVIFKAVVRFDCILKFMIQDEHVHEIKVTGTVRYPKISIEPKFIQIRKIETGALHRRTFQITNEGATKNSIHFPFESFPEFSVTDASTNCSGNDIVLEPDESRDLLLEFKPQEPTAYSLFLPYILNSLIGPAVLNNRASLNPRNYFKNTGGFGITAECPDAMPMVRVRCAAGAAWFTFSSLHLEFVYRGESCQDRFEITNVSNASHTVFLSVAGLREPFSIAMDAFDGNYKLFRTYFEVELSPDDKISWILKYEPKKDGPSEAFLPIAVDANSTKNDVFNYLRLTGSYNVPKIVCEMKMLYLKTIPVEKQISKRVAFKLSNHKEDCSVTVESDHTSLTSILETSTETDCDISVHVSFSAQQEGNVSSRITVRCTCGAVCELPVKCAADNCKLISYGFYLEENIQDKDERFPYFPNDSNNRKYLDGMNAIVNVIEKFLYNQGFFYTDFFKIPDTISTYPFEIYKEEGHAKNKKNEMKKEKPPNLPLVQLLINLIDESVLKYFTDGKSKPSLDDLQGTVYDYGVYKNVIKFLEVYEIFVQQLRPELLLTYDRYTVFKQHLTDKDNEVGSDETILSQEDFYSLSKQCWIDLLLNIYKVFVFDRTLRSEKPETTKRCVPPRIYIYETEFSEYFAQNISNFQNYNENKAKLMLWLEFHFNNQKAVLWPKENIKPRIIRSLVRDVKDSMPFVTLMAAYCPYIIDDLKNAYSDSTESLLFHNACVASNSWTKLNLSYSVKPRSLYEPIDVGITMLLTYLYEVLPNFYPSETIQINSPLGETTSNEIELKNCGDVPIAYTVTLFLNDCEEFEISCKTITIPPKKAKKLEVSYTAKSFLESKAVLVLSGETIGFRFARSKAANLIGIPDIFNFTDEYRIKANMYKPFTQQLVVHSPYAKGYVADTYFYVKKGDGSSGNDDFVPVSSLIKDKVPRQICINDKCVFNAEGTHTLNLKLCMVTCGVFKHYLYFLNRDVGVFCIKLTIVSKLSDRTCDNLNIGHPVNACEACKCRNRVLNYQCPRIINFELPCRNYFLLEGLRKMIEAYADENEYKFWDEHLVFPKGFHILGSYLENTFDDSLISFKSIMNSTVSFKTTVMEDKFSVAKTILIKDVTRESGQKISIHWDAKECPSEETLVLKAEHGQETRRYRVIFRN